ncbi:TetR/AcrR family transcriptional regulator [Neorhizobium galegae]|uniref:Putative HTH-type transcriptional regulator YcfQ n=1 Tax=Neorhizobium galegae bv. orientalis str. HAMBI 540 TaxID=1028800 RepID=A0A068SXG7_NEOGA|nr:TetR/AcrR family transcriptional regulator [Neorhizobium galegae]MCQ1855091.1 TetR/AcrR family transcriptional regulator [Neorhizobium galegae]CDN50559.1 Putative HTH-type transcriptional regulator YcfQ [Neorhizobium galegae bv. orientalis str. HAMBI 540]CDZ48636.1 YcfQ [Neorhizobium galegae bv. orientalis]
MDIKTATRPPGRPREFEIEDALDKAIIVFSERGYHAASISELKDAMGLAAGSLYKAFKDKKAIFLASFDRYKQVRNALLDQELAEGANGRDKVSRMLRFYAEASHGQNGRRGCLVVGTAIELAVYDADAAERVGRSMARTEAMIDGLIREGQADGSIPPAIDPLTTAHVLLSVTQGLRVLGKTGPNRDRAFSVVDAAMKLLD